MRTSLVGRSFVWLAALSSLVSGANGAQATFPSPEEAASALLTAVAAGNYPLFLSIAGTEMAGFWSTDDPVRDAIERDRFLDAARTRGLRIDPGAPGQRVLYVGGIAQQFPAPLIQTDCGWRFDGAAGAAELTTRRIRRNEAAVVELCRRLREAEFTYSERAYDGTAGFAQKINSTPGEHDGLFWLGNEDEESPLGPVFAAAAYTEQQPGVALRPLFGYYFRILSARSPGVPGDAPDHRLTRQLREGFAFIAWPADYGVGGLRSYLITYSGEIYQRDLGVTGSRFAENVSSPHPDRGWKRIDTGRATARIQQVSK